jgi:VRR-NUC domain
MRSAIEQKDLFTKRYRTVKVPSLDPDEFNIHKAVVERLRWQCRPGVEFWHTPNGELRDPRLGAKLKVMGLRPGVSDLLFFWNDDGERLRMLCLELKARGEDLSDNQRAFKQAMKNLGAYFEVADSVDEAVRVLRQYRILPPYR